MTTVVIAKTKIDYKIIADLAYSIWTEHYTPIIGKQQVTYMLEKFQSMVAIENQIKKGTTYYLLLHDAIPVGYFSFIKKEESLFISKLYVLRAMRGYGIGSDALEFIEKQAEELSLNKIELTVNKFNTNSIKAYEKLGFSISKDIVQNIGNGYVMDDYAMEKMIK